jgi:EAL domain-containing protein (putative c-di-GMP-specific phosphodiesterase class I)
LNVPVLAEGIETGSQATMLRLEGCDAGQGYLFGKPAPAIEPPTQRRVEVRMAAEISTFCRISK